LNCFGVPGFFTFPQVISPFDKNRGTNFLLFPEETFKKISDDQG